MRPLDAGFNSQCIGFMERLESGSTSIVCPVINTQTYTLKPSLIQTPLLCLNTYCIQIFCLSSATLWITRFLTIRLCQTYHRFLFWFNRCQMKIVDVRRELILFETILFLLRFDGHYLSPTPTHNHSNHRNIYHPFYCFFVLFWHSSC